VVAKDNGGLVGYVHVIPDEDADWDSLVDNVPRCSSLPAQRHRHRPALQRGPKVLERATNPGVYMWVLEQNTIAQRFYCARGGTYVEHPCRHPVVCRLV
jgi:hypothetical protein